MKYKEWLIINLVNFNSKYCQGYIELLNEFKTENSDLIPDILEIECNNENEFDKVLKEISAHENGNHDDLD